MAGAAGELTEVAGHLEINVADFVTLEGDFAFRKSTAQVTLDDQSQVDVSLLTVGATGATAFAGLDGGTPDAIGFGLSDVEFALVLAREAVDGGPTGGGWRCRRRPAAAGCTGRTCCTPRARTCRP